MAAAFSIALLGLLAVRPALADFYLYAGSSNSVSEGGSMTETAVWAFNTDGDFNCDRLFNHASAIAIGDVDKNGASCDGCDENPPDQWNIQAFAIDNSHGTFNGNGISLNNQMRITIINGNYAVVDDDGNDVGGCIRMTGNELDCSEGIGADDAFRIFECITAITVNEL